MLLRLLEVNESHPDFPTGLVTYKLQTCGVTGLWKTERVFSNYHNAKEVFDAAVAHKALNWKTETVRHIKLVE